MKTNLLVLLIAAGMAMTLCGASAWPHWKHDIANTAAALHGTRAVPTPRWQYPVPGISDGQQGVVLDASNNVIFLTTGTGEIISMSPTGTNWITKIGGGGNWGGVSYGNNNIVYGTPYSSTSGVYALNAENGSINWSYSNAGDSDNVPTIGPDGTIYALNGAAQLVALTDLGASYTVKWTRAIGGGGYEGAGAVPVWQDPVGSGIYLWVNTEGSAAGVNNMTILRDDGTQATVLATLPVGKSWSKGAVRDGLCYLSTFTDYGTSNLYCLSTTGLVWQTTTGVNMFNSPALGANGRIYLAGQGGIVAAFDYLGTRQWITNYGTDEIVAAPTVLNNGILYVMSKTAGIVYCIKDNGSAAQVLWTYNAGSGLGGAPAIGNDGTLYLAATLRTIALAPYAEDVTPGPWPLCGNNKQRQGWYTNGAPLLAAAMVWSNTTQTTAPGGIWYSEIRLGSGVTDGQRFYIAVNPAPVNSNATLLALDLATGTSLWNGVLGGAGHYANGTPAVSPSRVYIGESTGTGSGGKHQVYGVNKTTGQIVWSNRLDWMIAGGMLLHNDRVYCESDWDIGLWCLNAESGVALWSNRYGAGEWAGNGPALSPDGSTLYVHGDDGQFLAIDAGTGVTLWSNQFAQGNGNLDPIVDAAGNIYCGFQGLTNDTEPDILVGFAPNGSDLWRMSFGTNVWSHGGYALSPDGSRLYCSVALPPATGMVAVNTADGVVLWSSPCGGTGGGCVVGAPSNIIVGVFDIGGGVTAARALRDNGADATILWTVQLSPTITGDDGRRASWSWPTILANGDVIVESSYGVIARITVPEPGALLGLLLTGMACLRRTSDQG